MMAESVNIETAKHIADFWTRGVGTCKEVFAKLKSLYTAVGVWEFDGLAIFEDDQVMIADIRFPGSTLLDPRPITYDELIYFISQIDNITDRVEKALDQIEFNPYGNVDSEIIFIVNGKESPFTLTSKMRVYIKEELAQIVQIIVPFDICYGAAIFIVASLEDGNFSGLYKYNYKFNPDKTVGFISDVCRVATFLGLRF